METGVYDRIVSVGMFEHVGVGHYDEFFGCVRDRLADDGVALLHTIGRIEGPGFTNPWIRKYIFPGGYTPALSEIVQSVERVGLWITDIEVLRLHYAETLRLWRERFLANRERAKAALRRAVLPDVGVLSRRLRDRLPLSWDRSYSKSKSPSASIPFPSTRDYMIEAERALAEADQRHGDRAA